MILISKIAAIWYLVIIILGYITTNTGAYFNDSAEVSGVIQVGKWEDENSNEGPWDKSSLKFMSASASCSPQEVSAQIKNDGNDMEGNSKYEVYYAQSGNPKKGTKIGEGNISKITSNETTTLTYQVDKQGNYMFKALQRSGHPGKGELWSNQISNNCGTEQKNNEEPKSEEKQDVIENQTPDTAKEQEGSKDTTTQNENTEPTNENKTKQESEENEKIENEQGDSNSSINSNNNEEQNTEKADDPESKTDGGQ